MRVLGLIPARAGSQSIPHKNMAILGHRPLVQWVIEAALKAKTLTDIICTTDDSMVMEVCSRFGIPVHRRPEHLSHGDRPIQEIILDAGAMDYDAVALLQPTSPFVTHWVIDECVGLLADSGAWVNSVQTVTLPPHNHHAFNQREVGNGYVTFRFDEERKRCFNKQLKPVFCVFGNLVVTRSCALEMGVFANLSMPVFISPHEAVDVDGPEDLEYAEYLIEKGKIHV